ncbi:MAG: carbon storage regulator [Planctomycetales bacterium]|nr:carbon storage regulator [Planctomycetales bacterium]
MLVLTRKEQQTIRIGDEITVVVGRVANGRVRLVIDAPVDVSIDRGEVWQRKHESAPTPTVE